MNPLSRLFETAWVIARRDFVATVMSRSFILFLIAPLFAMGFAMLIGEVTKQTDRAATQPSVAIVTDSHSAEAVREARERLAESLGGFALPDFRTVPPEKDVPAQIRRLLSSDSEHVSAVLSGDLAKPVLTAPQGMLDAITSDVSLVVDDARRSGALKDAGVAVSGESLVVQASGPAAGNLSNARYNLARAGQIVILLLTFILSGMMLSNLVEEKSNKVIEVLSASVPVDAIFLGKLLAMLGVSAVGISIWGSIAGIGLFLLIVKGALGVIISPAVGWPAYCVLILLYFITNYMLLGTLFLSIGGQASSMREVQTLSMPVTFAQLGVFALAGSAVAGPGQTMFWVAVLFPFSAPMSMIAFAAQNGALWPHLLALLWQLLWGAIVIRVAARMFRRSVFKSGNNEPLFRLLPKRS